MEFLADAAFGATSARTPSIAELERFSLERAQTITQEGQDLASSLGLAVETRIERSQASVWQTILDVAAEIDAEMVVIGTHGATAVQSLLWEVSPTRLCTTQTGRFPWYPPQLRRRRS